MTDEHYVKFRDKFRSIVYYKGKVTSNRAYISRLYAFDKEGSHTKSIEKAMAVWKESKSTFELELNGKTYEQWKEQSKIISAIRTKVKNGSKYTKSNAVERYEKLDITAFICSTEETLIQN